MKCSHELINAYVDEELEPGTFAAVAEHLADCWQCTQACSRILEQREAIRSLKPYYAAPTALRESIRQALRKEEARETAVQRRDVAWRWLAIAASVLLAASLGWNLTRLESRRPEREFVAQSILSSHVRSLIGTHLLDVASTDQHTVKPWFNGKLDFSPEVRDFAAQGFPLVGGRIEYIAERPVAALVYRRRQHVINLFTWPSASSGAMQRHFASKGYNVAQWSDSSMTYWVVSDIPASEVQQFEALCAK
jgi:anti-sigma factor RsiW